MKNKLKYLLVVLCWSLPAVKIIWSEHEYLMVVYEDDYEGMSDEDKKILEAVFAPAKLTLKKRPWTFD